MFDLFAQGGEPPSAIAQFLPLIFIFLIFYFLLIRPNSKKQKTLEKKRQAMLKGDKVLIAGGIYGKVSHEKDDGNVVVIDIAPSVKIEVLRSAIADVLVDDAEVKERDAKLDKKSK